MAIFNSGRGSTYQKFQIPTMATFAQLSKCWQIALDRYTFAKQSYGVVVLDALPHAQRF